MTINDNLFDRIVDHMGDVRLYEEGVQITNRRIIKRHRKNLRNLLVKDIRSNVSPEIKRFGKELNSSLTNSVKEFSATQLDFHSDNIYKETRKFYKTTRPRTKQLLAEVTGPNIKGTPTITKNLNNIASGELVRIQSKVKTGLAKGMSQKDIINDVMKTTKITEHQARTLTRTSITSTQTAALNKVMDDNEEIIKGYMFTAILDARTSPICTHHNGKVYGLNEKQYRPPLHWNCRSSMIPVLKSKEELAEITSPKIKKGALLKIRPDRLNGIQPRRQSFGEWLKKQTYDVQSKMLGTAAKADMFRQGMLKVSEFVTPKGKALTITALRRRAAQATAVFNPKQIQRERGVRVQSRTPNSLLNNPKNKDDLRTLFLLDANDYNSPMALTDFKGTSLVGKQSSRRRVGNVFDERNFSADPVTGEMKNNLIYEPDFNLYQERIDFMRRSKLLSSEQKDYIENFVAGLDDKISVNQQTVVIENLRVVLERYAKDKKPWDDFASVVRAEHRFAVQNVSRLLDTRSRQRNQMFISYLSKDTPQVQIMGKYYTFDELSKNRLKDQRFAKDWDRKFGRKIANKAFYKGRAPLRAYFTRVTDKYIDLNKTKQRLLDNVIPLRRELREFKKKFKREPSDGWWINTTGKYRETFRNIVDLEFLQRRKTAAFRNDLAKQEKTMLKIVRYIAEGKSTDYDALAIKIGDILNEDFPDLIPGFSSTIASKHAEGSKILEFLREQGMIKIGFRGVVRRGVYDVDTGRASTGWGDTVSREVRVVNKDMLALQENERRLFISQRVGIVNKRDRLYVRANKKTFFDARGNDTGIPVVSASKFPDYDPKQIDGDMASMLNHVMSVEYEVDDTFAGFMDDLVRFRDPRGNVRKFDDLNYFRQAILTRGEQGYSLMSTIKYHRQRGKPFTTGVFIDSRGRVYHRGYLTPTGGELVRPFLNSAKPVNFSPEAYRELRIQIGAMLGLDTETLTNSGRLRAFERNKEELLKIGEMLSATTQRDRRIRQFLEHPIIQHAGDEPAEIPKIARLALEYYRLHNHVDGDFNNIAKLRTYKTKLMIENDASSSGAQIIGLSTGDRAISELSNVVQTQQKQRLYDVIAQRTIDDPDFRKIASLRDAGLTWKDLAKGAKYQNMVTFYGAGEATKAANVSRGVAKVLEKKGFITVTKADLSEQLRTIDNKIKQSQKLGADAVVADLTAFRKELVETVNNGSPVPRTLLKEAAEIHTDTEEFVNKLYNNRVGIVGPKDFDAISRIMSKYLEQEAPVTGQFIKFWKSAARKYVEDTGNVDIPWVTFDGKVMMQRYRPPVQQRIEFTDPNTGRKVRNIYEGRATDGKMKGKADLANAAIGLGVNGNHSNDAVIVRRFHQWGKKNNVDTGTIHDAFFTNIGDAQKAKDALRVIYADALEGDTIRKTLKAMRDAGMSNAVYNELLADAKRRGLIDPPNKLTRKDVLEPIKEGNDWYGIGP